MKTKLQNLPLHPNYALLRATGSKNYHEPGHISTHRLSGLSLTRSFRRAGGNGFSTFVPTPIGSFMGLVIFQLLETVRAITTWHMSLETQRLRAYQRPQSRRSHHRIL